MSAQRRADDADGRLSAAAQQLDWAIPAASAALRSSADSDNPSLVDALSDDLATPPMSPGMSPGAAAIAQAAMTPGSPEQEGGGAKGQSPFPPSPPD